MCPQVACLSWCKATLVTFVWLFSTVFLQMCPQNACLRGNIFALVTFFSLFSTVYFQVCPQIAWMSWCIITLVAFAWPFTLAIFCHSQLLLYWDCLNLNDDFWELDPRLQRIKMSGRERERCEISALLLFPWYWSYQIWIENNSCKKKWKRSMFLFKWASPRQFFAYIFTLW